MARAEAVRKTYTFPLIFFFFFKKAPVGGLFRYTHVRLLQTPLHCGDDIEAHDRERRFAS